MGAQLYIAKPLELKRMHFINTYPPFNATRWADDDCLAPLQDLALYVHIPFCHTICTYCFYKKFGNPTASVIDTYVDYLKREIVLYSARPEMVRKRVKTLYFGGGTPTVLTIAQLRDLVRFIQSHLDLTGLAEFCCEIMPHATATREKLSALKELGVTRLSFGVESFDEGLLRMHNRPCTRELYEWTYSAACGLQFDKINVDMMSGLAGTTWRSWSADIDALLAWAPPSISIYKTEVFYNTPMFASMRIGKQPPSLLRNDEEIEHIRYAHETLQRKGGYIVANCLHLLKDANKGELHYQSIWEGGDLKGLGLSAHSSYDGVLHQNASELKEYYAAIDTGRLPIKRAHSLTTRDRISQAMVYGLKNLAVNRNRFAERFGADVTVFYGSLITNLVDASVMTLDEQWLRITPEHYIFADDICRQFFLPEYEHMMPAHVQRDDFFGLTAL
jgi:oxygen-independent coproporphyrinogen-3 oxidase